MLIELTDDQRSSLQAYQTLLRDRAVELGLVSASDSARLGERHVSDSLRAAAILLGSDELVCDIGSGAGLPGIVLAIARPTIRFVLIEPKHRAAGFLELVVDRLGLHNVEVRAERVEELDVRADAATTRAFAALQPSWEAAVRVLRAGGRLIYFAGHGVEDPAAAARGITEPERARSVLVEPVVAGSSPLVIMTRHG